MATIFALPGAPPPPRLLPVTAGRRGDYALGDIARKLKLSHLSVPAILRHLRALHEQAAMPAPVNPRLHRGRIQRGAAAICKSSLWDAARWDQWHDRHLAPTPAEQAIASEALRRQLAANAAGLARAGRSQGDEA